MSDRPTGSNGKRSQAWGTTITCPACGRCLCFGCHPHGPCLDESDAAPRAASLTASPACTEPSPAWTLGAPGGVSGLRLR